jgi:small subunit ribosomal protein S4
MAKYTEARCRICRREGLKLFLKGERCLTDKCAIERKAYGPGQHKGGRGKFSEFGEQLREKQKLRKTYSLMEKQFKKVYRLAEKMEGITGENLLILLERRLDNVIYEMGFASSRSFSRQLIRHGHVKVNGKKLDIPSYTVNIGDEITISEKSKKNDLINKSIELSIRKNTYNWLEVDKDAYKGVYKNYPERDDIATSINEKLIVELYSK